MKKVFIIQNPVAGTQPAEDVVAAIEDYFKAQECEFEIHQTEQDENVAEIVARAKTEGFDLFVAAGGDGTVSDVAAELIGGDIPMAILPAGTGNALARDLNIPVKLKDALKIICGEHEVVELDAIEVDGHYSLLNMGVGFTTHAIENTSRAEKRQWGRAAYIFAGFKALAGIQPIKFRCVIDEKKVTFKAFELMMLNSPTLKEAVAYLNLKVENDDGVLDLFVIKGKTILDYLHILWRIIVRDPLNDPNIQHFTVHDSLQVESNRSLKVQVDGDLLAETPFVAKVHPNSLKVFIPVE